MKDLSLEYYVDVSDRSILGMEGPDGLDLLQRISTNDLSQLKPGEHAETVLTNEKGRIVDVLIVFRVAANSLVLAGASKGGSLLSTWIEKFVVTEDIRLTSLSSERFQLLMLCDKAIKPSTHFVRQQSLFAQIKYSSSSHSLLIGEQNSKASTLAYLEENGFRRLTMGEYELYRVLNSVPGHPNELSAQFNPLEVGLIPQVSFTKGCYVGQEVIARLDTYNKVQRSICRLRLTDSPAQLPISLFTKEGEEAGILTSFARMGEPGDQLRGLGIIQKDRQDGRMFFSSAADRIHGSADVLQPLATGDSNHANVVLHSQSELNSNDSTK